MPPKRVSQSFPFDEVHAAAEERGELVAHRREVPETPRGVVGKGDQDVDVALRTEVIPEHRSEERQLPDLPLAAEGFQAA